MSQHGVQRPRPNRGGPCGAPPSQRARVGSGIEFLDETLEDLTRLVAGYRRLLRGEVSGETLWREFKLINQLGVTRGQLGRASGADLGIDRWTDDRSRPVAG